MLDLTTILKARARNCADRTGNTFYVIKNLDGTLGVHSARFLLERKIRADQIIFEATAS